MLTKLKWKNGLFSSSYDFYSKEQKTGVLKNNIFSTTANGQLNGKKYSFKTTGVFQQRTEVTDNLNNKLVGEIIYNNWMSKASMFIGGKQIFWKYDNILNTDWSISNAEDISIKYYGFFTKGEIHANTEDELLVLTGMFTAIHYSRMLVVFILMCSLPIYIALFI